MDKKTTIINLYGGPGTGKSTTAAKLFANLKDAGKSVELVREYAKEWAWEGRKIGPFDQFYFFGKQSRKESMLYGKVDYIVTDSPILLGPYYASVYGDTSTFFGIYQATQSFLALAEKLGHTHKHAFLTRSKPYVAEGRYQTEEEAKGIDSGLLNMLNDLNIPTSRFGTDQSEVARLTNWILWGYNLTPVWGDNGQTKPDQGA